MIRSTSHVPCPTLGIIVSQFPETHETFIVRELTALRDAGIPLRIYSLKRCRDRVVHPEARALLDAVAYAAWDDPAVWAQASWQLVRHPRRALAGLGWVLRFHAWPPSTLRKAVVVWLQALVAARTMRRDRITHVHAHWATMPTTAAALVSRQLGVPFSFTAHAWDIFVPNPSLKEKVRLAVRVFTCTEYNRRYLSHLCPEEKGKIVLSYHGVNLTKFGMRNAECGMKSVDSEFRTPNSELRAPLFLSVGRLVETKGYDTLLEAYRQLKATGTAFRAVIVGDGPLRRRLARQIRANGLSKCVALQTTMTQDDLRRLYAGAFAFVLPCVVAGNGDRDGIPNVILEAMAMGLPVVSTTVSGIPEAVQDRRNGLLVAPGDPEQLARALALLLERRSFARVLGDHGRMWVETQFAERDHLQRFVIQMQELIDASGEFGIRNSEFGIFRIPHSELRTASGFRPVKVMYVIWSLEVGGAERIVASLAKGMDRTLVSPMVVCLNHAGALAEELTQADIPVIALEKRGKIDLMLLWRLVRLMRRLRPDVVHTHLWGANAWGRVAARAAGVPVVIANEHSVDSWKPRFYLQLDRWLAPLTTRLVAVSQHVREFYEAQGIGRGRWQVIYNGIEIETLPERRRNGHYAALGIRSYEPVVGFIGRLVSARAPQVFVEAIQRARREIPSLRAVIVGDGPLRRDTEAYARRLGLERRVIFTGTRRDVPELLAGMDALVFSSEREGCSLAMLEAMACGVPVVATKVGGTLEVIEAGVSGLLVEPRQPQALADRIIEVLNTPSKAEAIRVAARQRVEAQFSLPRMIAEYQQLYLDVARPPRRSQEAGRGNRRHET